MGAVLDEVVGPDVVRALGPQPDAGAVRQPEPATLGLLRRNLEPLAAPDPLDPLVVDQPARGRAQQLGDLAVAVAAILAGELDDVGGEPLLVISAPRAFALRRAMLAKRSAHTALGDPEQAIPWAERKAGITLAESQWKAPLPCSSRSFSASSSFRRLIWSSLSPPNS